MEKSTITDLPAAIEAVIPENERTHLIKQILEEAKAGEFHDFKNKKYVCGKVAVYQMLHNTNDERLKPIAEAIVTGEYDEVADEEDKALMKKDWLENGGTLESYKAMFGED